MRTSAAHARAWIKGKFLGRFRQHRPAENRLNFFVLRIAYFVRRDVYFTSKLLENSIFFARGCRPLQTPHKHKGGGDTPQKGRAVTLAR